MSIGLPGDNILLVPTLFYLKPLTIIAEVEIVNTILLQV